MNRVERRAAAKLERQASRSNAALWRKSMKIASQIYDHTPLREGARFTALVLQTEEAYVALRDGKATPFEVQTLAYARSLAWVFATRHGLAGSTEELAELESALTAIEGVMERRRTTGRIGATGPQLQAIREMVRTYEAQVPFTTPAMFHGAQALIRAAADKGDPIGSTLR